MKSSSSGNRIKIFLHLLAWIILLGLPVYFFNRYDVETDFVWHYYTSTTIAGIIFYINYISLVPRYFFESRKYRYYLSVFIILMIFFVISSRIYDIITEKVPGRTDTTELSSSPQGENSSGPQTPDFLPGRPPIRQIHLVNYIFTSLFLVFFSLGLRVLERHSETEKLQKELEREKLNSELALLKNQISPHFFFNTLNNIYSLIGINPEDSQKAVLKLSKLMRYLLYESEHGNTLLSNEIDFMSNYIDLMKLRMSEKVNLSISFPGKFDDISVPPLLFIPFIENAFKHGISYREKSFIEINMEVSKDSIEFVCKNSSFKQREENEKGYSGIGLENVGKRLNLLFPGKHSLTKAITENEYSVFLKINLS